MGLLALPIDSTITLTYYEYMYIFHNFNNIML